LAATSCTACGQRLSIGILICPQCGARPRIPSTATGTGPATAKGAFIQPAGFWARCAAFLIDLSLLLPIAFLVQLVVPLLAGILVWWVYFCAFETSRWHATPGKRVLGLHVTDINGVHLHFGRASLRFLCKILSAAPLFTGFLLAAFTRDKQTLHDLLAGTLVLRRK
jgi:uncharacterized RDD family membrane protein YckC